MRFKLKNFAAMVLIALAAIISSNAILPSAIASPLQTQQPPSWVLTGAKYDFDFANNRYYNGVMWRGSGNSSSGRAPSMMAYNGSGATANTLFVQTKSGILRPVEAQYQQRLSDYGLWNEGGPLLATNYALQARDFTQGATWTLSNISATKTSVVGADGTTGQASKLTATGAGGTALQTITRTESLDSTVTQVVNAGGTLYSTNDILTVTGGTCTTQPQLKVTTQASGIISAVSTQTVGACTVLPSNPVSVTGGTGSLATFNLVWKKYTESAWIKCVTCTGAISLTMDNSSFTDISGSLNSSSFTQVAIKNQQMINPTFGIKIANSADVIIVDFFQLEGDDQATSPILTTTTTNIRGAELYTFGTISGSAPNAGLNILQYTQSGTPMGMVVSYSGNFSTLHSHLVWGTDQPNDPFLTGAAGGGVISFGGNGGSLTSTGTDTSGLFTLNKVAFSTGGNGSKICVNGVGPDKSSVPNLTSAQAVTHGNGLNNGSNVQPVNGFHGRVTFFERELTDGECVRYSTVINNQ